MTLYRYAIAYLTLLAGPLTLLLLAMRARRTPGTRRTRGHLHVHLRADTEQLLADVLRARLLTLYYATRPARITIPRSNP